MAWIGDRQSANDIEALLVTIAVLRTTDPSAPVLATIVTANTRCTPDPYVRAAPLDAELNDLWTAELRCPPSVEEATIMTSNWGADYWRTHRGPSNPVALRAAVVAVAQYRRHCPTWSTTTRALDLYGNAPSAYQACVQWSNSTADFLRDKAAMAWSAHRPAQNAAEVAVGVALAAFGAALGAALGAWRSGRRVCRLRATPESVPYRSAQSYRCERHGI
ncbi:MAG: hypothetical protein Q8S73_34255 [Deltaproteobacteria bacterium]|nr:hypothetical protein [Myxococcales bacterium]MDP3219212.1 hypothetical protein [Deltaproteobacteria bacterium]